jgi:hypothetical protein
MYRRLVMVNSCYGGDVFRCSRFDFGRQNWVALILNFRTRALRSFVQRLKLLRFDPRRFNDRPALRNFALLKGGKCFGSQLVGREEVLSVPHQPFADLRVGKSRDSGGIEFSDVSLGVPFGAKSACQFDW